MKTLLGLYIQDQRIHLGMTILHLAQQSGVSKYTIHKIEKGYVKKPHLKTMKRIANALGLKLKDLKTCKLSGDFYDTQLVGENWLRF